MRGTGHLGETAAQGGRGWSVLQKSALGIRGKRSFKLGLKRFVGVAALKTRLEGNELAGGGRRVAVFNKVKAEGVFGMCLALGGIQDVPVRENTGELG